MKNLRLFNVISFIKGLYFYLPIFTLFVLSKDISLPTVVISQTFYSLFVFLGEVPTGIFADYFGQKTSIIIGYILEAFGILLVLFYPTPIGLYVSYSIRGFADSFLSGSKESLLFETVKHLKRNDYQKIYGKIIANEQIGFIMATFICGVAYQYFKESSFVPLIILTAFCMFITGILSIFLKNYKTETLNEEEGSKMFSILKQSFSLIKKDRMILTLSIVGVLTISGQYIIQGIYQPYFQNNGVSAFWIGAVLSFGSILNILAIRNVHLLEKYFSFEKILLIINLGLGLTYIFMALFTNPILLVVFYILMNGFFNTQIPIVSNYINLKTKSYMRATVLSGVSFIRRFFQIFITWVVGISVGIFGIQHSIAMFGLYLIVGICIGYYLLVRCGCTEKVTCQMI